LATKWFLSERGGELDLQIAARVVNLDASRVRWFMGRWFIGKGLLAGYWNRESSGIKRLPEGKRVGFCKRRRMTLNERI
jgi:hypothetical protein